MGVEKIFKYILYEIFSCFSLNFFTFVSKEINKNRQNERDITYIKMAKNIANLSHANKKKVGCLIVKNSVIISDGYNGTPSGFENECEYPNTNKTKWYTLHAEANAITKLVRIGGVSALDSTLYCTCSPCKECSKLILQSGIKRVIYDENYKDDSGIIFLKNSNIDVFKINNIKN